MKSKWMPVTVAAGLLALFSVAGCAPKEEASTGSGEGAAERAGKAVDQAGANVKEGTKEAVNEAGEAVSGAGKAVGNAAENAGEAVGGAVSGAAAKVVLTPKVKNALIADKSIDGSTLNVDTNDDTKTVTVTGTQSSADRQKRISEIAKKVLADAKSSYKVDNKVTVAK